MGQVSYGMTSHRIELLPVDRQSGLREVHYSNPLGEIPFLFSSGNDGRVPAGVLPTD